ncbi:hypothetical protein TRAPUB_7543 [Trametes pubescens]|uniref:Uncharacterized protein n=1 Tax=Trametes pubescens TaxID=154538 RepID=A0A1M2V321_TRAPU|nr:hypothetical protein TRAPUB_7543 [Trametes pubescens]
MSSRAATLNISELSSIHRLPPELLMPILCDARQRLQDIRFAHVCRHWRTLLLATPEYWVSTLESLKIAPYTPVGLVMHCLTLSSPRPIKVQVIFMGQTERQLLAPHASRIAQLSILGFMGEAAVQAFEGLLKDSLPVLTNLRYDCDIPFLGSARTAVHPLSDFPLPSLRHLEIPSSFPLHMCATPALTHLVVNVDGPLRDSHRFREALSRCRSLQTLAFRPDDPKRPISAPVALSEHPPQDKMPRLRRISFAGTAGYMTDILAHLNMPPPDSLHLRATLPRVDIRAVLASPTVAAWNIVPTLTRLYIGRTYHTGRIHVLGYAHVHKTGVPHRKRERLDIALWSNWAEDNALVEVLRAFTVPESEVVALAVALPRLPPSLERSAWGRPWAGSTGDTGSGTFELPCALRRLELLGGMSDSAKVRLARGFVRASGGVDRPPSRELTLCWVLDVARGFACEERAGDELRRLGKLLEEFDSEGCQLGRLELYGMLQSWVIATRVGEVSTNAQRCAEVAGSLLPHFEELVDVVVLM